MLLAKIPVPKKIAYISIMAAMIGNPEFLSLTLHFGGFYWNMSIFRFLALFLFLYTLISDYSKNAYSFVRKRPVNYSMAFMLIWILYAVISILWVKDKSSWFPGVFFLAIGFIVAFLYLRYFKTSRDILTALYIMAVMMALHNILGWFEVFTGKYLFYSRLFPERIDQYITLRFPVTTFKNTNDFSTFMVLSFWVAYICYKNAKSKKSRILFLVLMISSILLPFQAGSRANMLGLLLSIIVLFVLRSIKQKRFQSLVVLGLLLLILYGIFNLDKVHSFLQINFDDLNLSDQYRMKLIINGLHFVKATNGLGVGAGNVAYWLKNASVHRSNFLFLHNWWVEILATYGVSIFILYLVFYVRLFKSMVKKYLKANSKLNASISLAFACFMGGFVISSMSSSTNMTNEWLWVFWGIIIAYQGIDNNCTEPKYTYVLNSSPNT